MAGIKYAKDKGIPVGPGRGSAVGSLASYSLGITDIDPIPYGLIFERFLNEGRNSMPDIDVDICMEGRDDVIKSTQATEAESDSDDAPGIGLPGLPSLPLSQGVAK